MSLSILQALHLLLTRRVDVTLPGWTEEVSSLVGESTHSLSHLARSLAGPGSYAQWHVAVIGRRDMFPWRRNGTMLYVDQLPLTKKTLRQGQILTFNPLEPRRLQIRIMLDPLLLLLPLVLPDRLILGLWSRHLYRGQLVGFLSLGRPCRTRHSFQRVEMDLRRLHSRVIRPAHLPLAPGIPRLAFR